MAKKGLGKGLDALFADNAAEPEGGAPVTLRLSEIEPNRDQPRRSFGEESLAELAESIRENGVLQPLMVRPLKGSERYQLVAGERRWRAARMAGLDEVPVIIRELDDRQTMEIALIENLQRENLDPVEEANGYGALIDEYGLTQEEVARRVGKSRPAVTNALRLLSLPDEVLGLVRDGSLSAGHGRALLACSDAQVISAIAADVVKKGLSVRETERLAKKKAPAKKAETEAAPEGAPEAVPAKSVTAFEVEQSLTERLGRRVTVVSGKKSGTLVIEFYGEDDLKELSHRLAGE